jgi:hypothetical protein
VSDSGYNLRVASGARRLTVHCRYCGAMLPCPPEEDSIWVWMKKDEVQEFYRFHREHAGAFADRVVGAEIDYDDDLVPNKKDDLPPLMNLLSPENMAQIKRD